MTTNRQESPASLVSRSSSVRAPQLAAEVLPQDLRAISGNSKCQSTVVLYLYSESAKVGL